MGLFGGTLNAMTIANVPPNNPTIPWSVTLDPGHHSFPKWAIGHFTVVYSVTWPMNGSEAAGDLVLIQTSLFLSCKLC